MILIGEFSQKIMVLFLIFQKKPHSKNSFQMRPGCPTSTCVADVVLAGWVRTAKNCRERLSLLKTHLIPATEYMNVVLEVAFSHTQSLGATESLGATVS